MHEANSGGAAGSLQAGAGLTPSALERGAEGVPFAPDEPTVSSSAKIVKGQFKVQWQHRQISCANSGTPVCDVRNAARAHAGLSAKE